MDRTTAKSNAVPPAAMRLGAGPDRLDSWKEIASYLKREVRTVQLWEKREGLPVHRHFHNQLGTVFAFRSEIEAWGRSQARRQAGIPTAATEPVIVPAEEPRGDVRTGAIRIEVCGVDTAALDPAMEAMCRAIVTETTEALKGLDRSKIVLHDADVPPREGVAESGAGWVDYLLRWEIRYQDDGVGLCASLTAGAGQAAVWSRTFPLREEMGSDGAALVADQIAQCLWLKAVCSVRAPRRSGRAESEGSREAYLKGRYFWSRRNEDGMRKAIACFRSAIEKDPTFALPYSGLADALTMLSFYEIALPAEVMPEARRAALRAIELNPELAEAHASLGDIHLHFDRDWEGADREYRQAIECNPRYALGYHWYANLLAARGQHDAARIAIMHALEIDPVSLITQVWAGVTSHLAHRFDDAIRHYQSALELDPQFIWAHMYLAQALEQTGRFPEALHEFETTIQMAGGSKCVTAMKAHAHAIAGDRTSAREILRELSRSPVQQGMPSYDIAATHAALGNSDETVLWLKRACRDRNMKLFTLTQDPRFDPLRRRAEFREVVDQIGMARYHPPIDRL